MQCSSPTGAPSSVFAAVTHSQAVHKAMPASVKASPDHIADFVSPTYGPDHAQHAVLRFAPRHSTLQPIKLKRVFHPLQGLSMLNLQTRPVWGLQIIADWPNLR